MTAPDTRLLPPLGSGDDPAIAHYLNRTLWDGYQEARRGWLRQVEENVRNLAGQQYTIYLPETDRFEDLASLFYPGDDRWREAPVFNWLGQHWFMVQLAKLTENPPVLGALPSTGDARDAMTAAIFDPFFRFEWSQMGMPEQQYPLAGWILTAGEAVGYLRWNPDLGEPTDTMGSDHLQIGDGHPLAEGPEGAGESERPGDLAWEVLAPTSVLFPFGPEPHWAKPWVMREYWMPVEDARERWNAPDLEPSRPDPRDDLLARLSYTSFYGNSGSPGGGTLFGGGTIALKDCVKIRERWGRQKRGEPYGRWTVVTPDRLLYDDINPYVVPGYRTKVIVPFFRFPRPGYPFRQEGVSDLESLNPVARALNRSMGSQLDYADFNEQPPLFYNDTLVPDDRVEEMHRTAARIGVSGDPNQAAAYLNVPPVPPAIQQTTAMLREMLDVLGGAGPYAGTVPNDSRSGELLKEDRFNSDRPMGATLRLQSWEWARVGQAMLDIAAVCMTDDRVLAMAGESQALQFVTVRPDLFQGRINVYPLPESAILETRSEKQNRLTQAFTTAATLPPPLGEMYLQSLQHPDLAKAFKMGSEAKDLAERQVAEMVLMGQLAPVLPEQDHAVHVAVVQAYMQTLGYRNQPEPIKQVLRGYKMLHELMGQQVAVEEAEKQGAVMGAQAEAMGVPDPREVAEEERQANKQAGQAKLKRVK